MTWDQIVIALFGVGAVWLTQDRREGWRRWACLLGLCSQPGWFWAAYTAEQWGIFGVSFLYTLSWLRGFRAAWWPLIKARLA